MTEPKAGRELAIVAHRLGKSFGAVQALSDVELEVARGTLTAVVGDNGSGKSTLLALAAGLFAPDTGTIRVLGHDAAAAPRAQRRRIGYVAQTPELDPEMTGAETLALFSTLYAVGGARARDELSAELGLGDVLGRPVATYSGGQRQRLHLGLGFLHRPELLLLDEPGAALDPAGRGWLWARLKARRDEGATVVVVTHDLAEAEVHCDRIALVHRGRLVACAAPAEIVREHARARLEIELEASATPEGALERIRALSGVSGAKLDGSRLLVEIERAQSAGEIKDRVLALLLELRAGVVGFRLNAADLASAYFRLTGRALSGPAAPREARAQRAGRGERVRAP